MNTNIYDFLGYAAAVGYPIKDLPDDAGYLPAIGEMVLVHSPDGHKLGLGEVLRHDPTGPYVAVMLGGCAIVVHLADIQPANYHGEVA